MRWQVFESRTIYSANIRRKENSMKMMKAVIYYSTDELKVSNQNTTCLMKTEEQSTEYGLKKTCSPLYNQGKSILFEFSLVKLDCAKNLKKI